MESNIDEFKIHYKHNINYIAGIDEKDFIGLKHLILKRSEAAKRRLETDSPGQQRELDELIEYIGVKIKEQLIL